MIRPDAPVFLLDVDNTLLDNDRFGSELNARLEREFGGAGRTRYWALYERLRGELGYADYLGALQAFRHGLDDHAQLLRVSQFVLDYPFAQCLYPRALEAIAHLRGLGLPVVLTDGDVVFQPHKARRAGIWDAVSGRVLICVHKQHELDAVQRCFPAPHYVMVDDKARLLAEMKQAMGDRLTTVYVRQGHYARELPDGACAAPDIVIDRIAELVDIDPARFAGARDERDATAKVQP
jgi:FMN phosphatase YigB (HAD superfamily)